MTRAMFPVSVGVAFCLCSLFGCARPPASTAPPPRGGLDATFLVTADLHFGAQLDGEPIEKVHQRAIAAMRSMAGRNWPDQVGGTVDQPRGLLVAGDITDKGFASHWNKFARSYLSPQSGPGVPVYETVGNHESYPFSWAAAQVALRHGSVRYSWDWDDLHVICLGEAAGSAGLAWLEQDLAATGRDRPIVIFQHFPLAGPWSENTWFAQGAWRDRLASTLDGFNVIAIFHGHYHGSDFYQWRGRNVINVGSARHSDHSFAVVRVTDHRLTVARWDWDRGEWTGVLDCQTTRPHPARAER